MTNFKSTPVMVAAAAIVGLTLAAPLAVAQQPATPPSQPPQTAPDTSGRPPGPIDQFERGRGRGRDWSPGMMMGPGMMPMMRGGGAMCSPRAAGLAEWRVERLTRVIRPTDAQRAKLDELKVASVKAAEVIAETCAREFPLSAPARLEWTEKRLEAMLNAVKNVRPAFDAFYATLDEEQKTRLNSAGPRGWGWRDRRWRDR